ncbi:MAG: hypothetical protein QM691_02765 [Opitutaceae bacterium]
MKPLPRLLLAALLASLATAATLTFLQRDRSQSAARLRQDNNRLRFEAGLRRQRPAAPVPTAAESAPEITPSGPTEQPAGPASDYRDAGRSTPQATLQTFAWACASGDAKRVERLLYFERAAREKAQAYLATLPETAGGSAPTPEAMAAALFTAGASEHPFPAATILEKATPAALAADRVLLELPGAGPLREHTEYVKRGDVWSYVVTEAMVDDYIARVGAPR